MSDGILVINAGSSSIKFTVYLQNEKLHLVTKGQLEGLGVGIRPHFEATDTGGAQLADETWDDLADEGHPAALSRLIDWIEDHLGDATLKAAGHRVVHGGPNYGAPVRVTEAVVADLKRLIPLAPLHQPHNLAPIETLAELHPNLPQVACFDTAFHRTKPRVAQLFGLPRGYADEGVTRYGFHGLSYEYIAHALPQVAPEVANGRVVVAHLGSGASMCALKGGVSMDTSMGFTALDGLMMGTRTGSLDAGVVLYLLQQKGLDAAAIEKLLYKESGLLGVSGGLSNDMRVLLDSARPEAQEAVDLFVYRAAKEVGALAATIGGLDALVFTAGIGEHAVAVRQAIMDRCAWLGVVADSRANEQGGPCLTTPDSKASAWVIPTDEELMIARHTRDLVLR